MHDQNTNDINSDLTKALLKEKRSDRRWKTFRSLAWLIFIAFAFFQIVKLSSDSKAITVTTGSSKHYAALIRLDGLIAPGRSFSADEVLPALRKAFADKHAQGVIIDINSPGGTPVQSSIIHDAILAYKKKYNKKVIIVGEDLLTSGAYFVAVAGDKIYVNPNSLTGSVGVIMKGFGFVDLIKKIGVERRVYVDGDQKDRLDPFLPQTPEDIAKIHEVMGEVHHNFAQAVLDGRKGKLKATPEVLFSGDFWTGQKALELGLVDALGNLMDASEKEFGTTKFKVYGDQSNFLKMLSGQLTSAFDSMVYTMP